jgi:hypothetical protein
VPELGRDRLRRRLKPLGKPARGIGGNHAARLAQPEEDGQLRQPPCVRLGVAGGKLAARPAQLDWISSRRGSFILEHAGRECHGPGVQYPSNGCNTDETRCSTFEHPDPRRFS